MAFEKCVFALILVVLAIGYIEGASKGRCSSLHRGDVDVCFNKVNAGLKPFFKETCDLKEGVCPEFKTFVQNIDKCIKNNTNIPKECKRQLNRDLRNKIAQSECHIFEIQNECNQQLSGGDGHIEDVSDEKCKFENLDPCFQNFTTNVQQIFNKSCDANKGVCEFVESLETCITNNKVTEKKCEKSLPNYLKVKYESPDFKCNVSDIANKCKENLKTGGAPHLVISLFGLLVSVIAGFQYKP